MTGGRSRAAYLAGIALALGLSGGFPAGASAAQPYFTYVAGGQAVVQPAFYGAGSALMTGNQVLIAGGVTEPQGATGPAPTDGAETFNATTNTFTALTATMETARAFPVAAPLPDGDVLIAGGYDGTDYLSSAEIYDPKVSDATYGFTPVSAAMPYAFDAGVAAALPNGQVLIAGGSDATGPLDKAMIYDPASQTFTLLTSRLTTPRTGAFAAPLPNGEVLIGGGRDGVADLSSAELFDPGTETFTALSASTTVPRFGSIAAPLPDGNVVIAGGTGASGTIDSGDLNSANNSSELFSPTTDTFSTLPGTTVPALEAFASATALSDGAVVVAGGESPIADNGSTGIVATAELYESQPEASISLAPFSPQTVGVSSAPQTLTVTNVGYQHLSVSGVASLIGQGFLISFNECAGITLYYGAHCTMLVTFTPSGVGLQSAILTLADNEPVPSSVTFSGIGLNPPSGPPVATVSSAAVVALAMDLRRHTVSHRHVTVRYSLTTTATVTLTVTAAHGRSTVVDRTKAGPGEHTITWNGRLHGRRAKRGRYRLTVSALANGSKASQSTSVRL